MEIRDGTIIELTDPDWGKFCGLKLGVIGTVRKVVTYEYVLADFLVEWETGKRDIVQRKQFRVLTPLELLARQAD